MTRTAFILALILAGSRTCPADLTILQYNSQNNDRFYGAGNTFVGNGYDFSGVGKSGGQWATMISPSFALSAVHAGPGGQVVFHEDNNANGPTYTGTIARGISIAGSDLDLVQFTAPVPTAVARYNLASDTEDALLGRSMFIYGQTDRVGTNNVSGFGDFGGFGTNSGRGMLYDFDTTGASGPNEAEVNGGDSGGPSFIKVGNQLVLVGVHWFKYTETDGLGVQVGEGSGDTFVSNYINAIDAQMAAWGSSETVGVTVVPEPASVALTVVGLAAMAPMAARRRRRLARSAGA